MTDTYTKLFRSIAASTIVSEPLPTRWLWVTLLSQADKGGNVYGSIPGLARLANITIEEVEFALASLMSPDPYSRTPDNEGRRLEVVDGGWRLLNHAKYAAMRNEAERAEYKRKWDQENRPSGWQRQQSDSPTVRQKSDQDKGVSDTSPSKSGKSDAPDPTSTNTNTSSREKQKQERGSPSGSRLPKDWALPDDWREWAQAERDDVDVQAEAAKFADHWHSVPGAKARKTDWQATWRNWIRRADAPRRANGRPPAISPMDYAQ